MSWPELKTMLETSIGLSQDALHMYAAVLIQLVAAALTRKSLAHPLPWLVVLMLELVNEWADIRSDNLFEEWERWTALHDVVNTMALPTLLLVLARTAPRLFHSPRRRAPEPVEAEPAGDPTA